MKTYKAEPSYTDDMGSMSAMTVRARDIEGAREEVLWHYNSARRHDGLREWDLLPKHIIVKRGKTQ